MRDGETPDEGDRWKRGVKDGEEKAEARLPLIQLDLIRATNFAGELIECCRRDWRYADYCMPV